MNWARYSRAIAARSIIEAESYRLAYHERKIEAKNIHAKVWERIRKNEDLLDKYGYTNAQNSG